jgi:L-gulonolactone oxidase
MPTLTNWNHEIRFDVADDQFKTPTEVSDVQAIVKQASERNQPVKVVRALHSTTECMVGAGIVISMKNMDRVLSLDKERLTVTVQAGVSLHQLCSHLKEKGLQPPVVLEFGNFQIGAVSGTHANDTSITRQGQFSSFVLGVKLVTPTGDVMEISETQNVEYLPAIRSHFGMFGVVCEVTLRVFKNKPLQVSIQTTKVNSFVDGFAGELEALKAGYDQVFGMLFPHSGKLLWQCRKFVEPEPPSLLDPDTWTSPIASKGINLFKDVLLPLVKAGTAVNTSAALAELLSAAVIELPIGIFRHVSYVIDPCDRGIVYSEHDPAFDFYDWMFPEQKWCDMMRAFLELSDRFRRKKDFALPLPALIYFVKKDEASLLSRSRHADMMAIDPTYPDQKSGTWKEFRLAFNEIAMKHGGIPHINKTRDGAISHFAKAHDPDIIKLYLKERKELDPKDLFLNDFFRKMFAEYL